MELPQSTNVRRIIPNDFIRSSLFTVSNHRQARKYLKNNNIYSFGKTEITYTGEELRQDDEDVWLQLLYNAAKEQNFETEFMPYSFLKQLDWAARVQYREKLFESINRMVATNITIKNKYVQQGLSLSLVRKFSWQDKKGDKLKFWKVWLEPEVLKLFENYTYTRLLWDQRKKLKPLAKWLHAYYSSHADPYSVKVSTLHIACGSNIKQQKHFKENLRNALFELVSVGFLIDFYIGPDNLVYVTKKQKKSQFIKVQTDIID